MNRLAEGTVVFASGAALVTLYGLGTYVNYVKPNFGIILLVTGLILLVLGTLTMADDLAPRDERATNSAAERVAEPVHEGHAHGHHGHSHHGPGVGWMLLAPIVVLSLVQPPALGADAAARQDDQLRRPPVAADDFLPKLPAEDPAEIDIAVFTMHAQTDEARTLRDRTVSMLGFVTPAADGRWYLTRMTLACCAADAYAYKVHILGADAPPTDSWVVVEGVVDVEAAMQANDGLPALQATSVRTAQAPNPPYL